jgi:hypothetical protein
MTPPIWGSDEFKFKIGGQGDRDTLQYGLARGVWWQCYPFGSGLVARIEDPAVLQELDKYRGEREQPLAVPPAVAHDFVVDLLLDRASVADSKAAAQDVETGRHADAARESLATANRYRDEAAALRTAAEKLAG